MERADFRFTRREVRELSGWGHSQLALHLARLVELEYLVVHHGTNGQRFVYELAYDGRGQDGTPFLVGLIDVAKLGYDGNLPGFLTKLPGSFRAASGQLPGGFRPVENSRSRDNSTPSEKNISKDAETAHLEPQSSESYVLARRSRAPLSSLAAAVSARPAEGA